MNNNYEIFDIYSKRIGFFFNNREKIGTLFGFLLTMIYVLISLSIFCLYIFLTINRKFMKVYDSTTYSKDIPFIDINQNIMYFAFGLENPNTSNRFIDEKIYYPKIEFVHRKKINGEFKTIGTEELEYEICQEEKFGKDYEKFFPDGELNNSYCLKNFNFTLIGGYKYAKMSYLRISILPCNNNTKNNNNHCKSQDIIDYYLKGGYFSILTKDIGLDPTNYSFPVISTLQDLYTPIDKSIHKKLILYYRITEIKTDIGLFSEDIKTEKYFQYKNNFESFYFRDEKDNFEEKPLISVDFRLDDIIFTQKRVYTKMTEIFYIIGGYMQLINTVFTLLSILSKRVIPELKILNGIFNFNLKEKKMTMRIHSIKEFNTIVFKKSLYFPSNKSIMNFNNNLANNNKVRNSLKVCYNKNSNNLSRNSLIGIDNNENNSSVVNIINNKKHNSLVMIKEKEEKSNSNNNSSNSPIANERKNNNINNNNDFNKSNGNRNYIYRVGSFYPKYNPDKKQKNNSGSNLKEFIYQINFNIFDYYCFRRFLRKRNDIELYKLGLSIYAKRMDIINVFTLLILAEKNCLLTEELE